VPTRRALLVTAALSALPSLLSAGCGSGGDSSTGSLPTYRATPLPPELIARDLNDAGQLLLHDDQRRAFRLDGAALVAGPVGETLVPLYTREGPLARYTGISADALSEAGTVAVNAYDPETAILWKGGVLEPLPLLQGATGASVTALNASGLAVGRVTTPDSRSRAVLWRPGEGAAVDLGDLGGVSASANDINARGEIVGSSEKAAPDGPGPRYAFLWREGRMIDLGAPAGQRYSQATRINDAGTVVGQTEQGAFVYSGGRMQSASDVFGRPVNLIVGLNNQGDMIGAQVEGLNGPIESKVVGYYVRLGGRTAPFEDLLPAEWRGRGVAPSRINDRGQILAGYWERGVRGRYLLLTPAE